MLLALHCLCNPLKKPNFSSEANPNQSLHLCCVVRGRDEKGGGNGKVAAYPASQLLSHSLQLALLLSPLDFVLLPPRSALEGRRQWGGVKIRWDFQVILVLLPFSPQKSEQHYLSALPHWRAVAQLYFVIKLNLENNFFPCIQLMSERV